MKLQHLFLWLIALIGLPTCFGVGQSSISNTGAATSAKKRALLIGIPKYDRGNPNTDWWDLHSDRDVDELAKVLKSDQFKFDEVRVLKTQAETTHSAIVNTFRNWLIQSTKERDVVYFHYSGHGHQAPDTNTPDNPIVGDELSGLDETLVPSDYVSIDDPSKDIRDDEIGILLGELARKHPAQVFLSFDSCFAGSITRGTKGHGRLVVRGKGWNGPKPTPQDGSQVKQKSLGGFLTRDQATAQGYVVLSATRDNQLASETPPEMGPDMGLLTRALVDALNHSGVETTYRDLFEQVNTTISSQPVDQNPELEGSEIDNVLFTGIVKRPEPYIPVDVSQGNLLLRAGSLQNITKDSVFALYTAGSDPKTATPLASGTVSNADFTVSTLQLNAEDKTKGVKIQAFRAGRAKEIKHSYGENLLRVDVQYLGTMKANSDFANRLSALPLVKVQNQANTGWDVRLCAGDCPELGMNNAPIKTSTGSPSLVSIQRADGTVLAQVPINDQALDQITPILQRESRWQFVNKLANKNSAMKIDLRIVPVEVKTQTPCGTLKDNSSVGQDLAATQTEAKLQLSPCDYVMLEVRYTKNDESAPAEAWVSILDLQNNGKIGALWPNPRNKTQDNHIPGDGQWHRIPFPYVIRIEEPLGKETFKAIATSEATDFGPVVDSELRRGARDKKEQNAINSPLGQLLRAAAQGKRSTIAATLPLDWTSTSMAFEVVERK